MSTNIEKFATVMANRMKKTSDAAVPTVLELGTINSSLALLPDGLQAAVPRGDYMVNLLLTGELFTSSEAHLHEGGAHGGHEGGDGTHTHNGGLHNHEMPDSYRNLSPGDRVLIAWCGNEPVVIAIVVRS